MSLAFLPLRLLGISTAMLWMPFRFVLKMFARHTVAFLVGLVLLILFFYLRGSNEKLPALTPTAAPRKAAGKNAPLIEPVRKTEDGDSNFATDLYASMTDQERVDYSKNYYWAMSSLADGQVHNWSAYNIAGSLRANTSFRNNSGDRCRTFNEVLKVHSIQQTISGTACEQGGGRWCKLKPNATPMCGLSGNSGFWSSFTRSLGL